MRLLAKAFGVEKSDDVIGDSFTPPARICRALSFSRIHLGRDFVPDLHDVSVQIGAENEETDKNFESGTQALRRRASTDLKLVRFPTHSPLTLATLPSMSLIPFAPFADLRRFVKLRGKICEGIGAPKICGPNLSCFPLRHHSGFGASETPFLILFPVFLAS